MNEDVMSILICDYLNAAFPIRRIRIPEHTGKFKRVIKINRYTMYRVSDNDQKYNAMRTLSDILCRVFNMEHSETVPFLKNHLHIK